MNEKRKRMVIDMQNPNALISMAYVSENSNNPYYCFCEYIKYSIYSSTKESFTLKDIAEEISNNFGIYLPYNIVNTCLMLIKKEGYIKYKHYSYLKSAEYDTNKFELIRQDYLRIEEKLINDLISFAKKYNKNWTKEYARDQLIEVLNNQGMAFDIFMDNFGNLMQNSTRQEFDDAENTKGNEKEDLFSDEFFTGKYICDLIKSETSTKEYLLKICEGLMICVGTYQLPTKDFKPVLPKIKSTEFLFDTRILLRVLGCADETAVEAINELVKLIQEGEGRIYYYPHTLEEVKRAFQEAIDALEENQIVKQREMMMFLVKINYNKAVLRAKKESVEDELAKCNIFLKPLQIYSEQDRVKFGFDLQTLTDYMYSKLSWWDKKTIENDAQSIWETHMLRSGKYDDYCGGSNHSAVFVTSNTKLIEVALKFKDDHEYIKSINNWCWNKLPVISDNRLTCRLWSPSQQSKELSLLMLAQNAVAAQKPNRFFVDRMRKTVEQLSTNVPQYSSISLMSYFDDNIAETLFEKTNGGNIALDAEVLACSLEELTALKNMEIYEQKENAINERDIIKQSFEDQQNEIIDGAVKYLNKGFFLKRVEYYCIKFVQVIIPVLISIPFIVLEIVLGEKRIFWAIGLTILVAIIEAIAERVMSLSIVKWLVKKRFGAIEKSFERVISKKLRDFERKYEKQIKSKVMETNPIILKYKSIMDNSLC